MDQVKTKTKNLRQVLRSTGIDEKEIMESQVTAVPAAAYSVGATGYQASITMRRMIDILNPDERTERIIERLKSTKTNKEFLASLKEG